MGIRTWAFLVKDSVHVDEVFDLIKCHNKLVNSKEGEGFVGEEIFLFCMIKHEDEWYMEVMSFGGGDISSKWISMCMFNIPKIYYPFDKPSWWRDKSSFEYIWRQDSKTEFVSPFGICPTQICDECQVRYPRGTLVNDMCNRCITGIDSEEEKEEDDKEQKGKEEDDKELDDKEKSFS